MMLSRFLQIVDADFQNLELLIAILGLFLPLVAAFEEGRRQTPFGGTITSFLQCEGRDHARG